MSERALMTRQDVADYLNVSVRQVDKIREAGKITDIWVEGQVRFRPSDIEDYLSRNAEPAAPQEVAA